MAIIIPLVGKVAPFICLDVRLKIAQAGVEIRVVIILGGIYGILEALRLHFQDLLCNNVCSNITESEEGGVVGAPDVAEHLTGKRRKQAPGPVRTAVQGIQKAIFAFRNRFRLEPDIILVLVQLLCGERDVEELMRIQVPALHGPGDGYARYFGMSFFPAI